MNDERINFGALNEKYKLLYAAIQCAKNNDPRGMNENLLRYSNMPFSSESVQERVRNKCRVVDNPSGLWPKTYYIPFWPIGMPSAGYNKLVIEGLVLSYTESNLPVPSNDELMKRHSGLFT